MRLGWPRIYPLKNTKNPTINYSYIHEILQLIPIIQRDIIDAIQNFSYQTFERDNVKLNDNSYIVSEKRLDRIRKVLLKTLSELKEITWWKKSIIVIKDNCFTNDFLIQRLEKILWEDADNYMEVMDYNFGYNPQNMLDEKGYPKDSLIILWWSLQDAYWINLTHYQGDLVRFLKASIDDNRMIDLNNRIIWICFWFQLIANILNNIDCTPNISMTAKSFAQFGPFPCKITTHTNIPAIYRFLLWWLEDKWNNEEFTAFFTRTWHVSTDLLWTWGKPSIIPLIRDSVSNRVIWYGNRKWNLLCVQFHPEIGLEDVDITRQNLSWLIDFLKDDYGDDVYWICENFDYVQSLKKDIWDAFYIFALTWFLRDILFQIKFNKWQISSFLKYERSDYKQNLKHILELIKRRYLGTTRHSLSWNPDLFSWEKRNEILLSLFRNKLIDFCSFDWIVDRGIGEINEILWTQDLEGIISKHIAFMNEMGYNYYYFRDLWAWNGNLLKELYSSPRLKNRDVIYYGIWDKLYFNLYKWLKEIEKKSKLKIPDEIIKLIGQKIYMKIEYIKKHSKQREELNFDIIINEIFEEFNISINDTIVQSWMFAKEQMIWLSTHSQEFIKSNTGQYKMKKFLKLLKKPNIFTSIFSWFFERIYLWNFTDEKIYRKLPHPSFQIAIRSTSHTYPKEFSKVLTNYIKYSIPGSIMIENGIHESYTWIPRIVELDKIYEYFKKDGDLKIYLIFDPKTNYFTCAVISRGIYNAKTNKYEYFPFNQKSELKKGYKIVKLKKVTQCKFFRFEYFFRRLLQNLFKTEYVFEVFYNEIREFLKQAIVLLKNWDNKKLKELLYNLINDFIDYYNIALQKNYKRIDKTILDDYNIEEVWKLDDILYSPHGVSRFVNIDWQRRY